MRKRLSYLQLSDLKSPIFASILLFREKLTLTHWMGLKSRMQSCPRGLFKLSGATPQNAPLPPSQEALWDSILFLIYVFSHSFVQFISLLSNPQKVAQGGLHKHKTIKSVIQTIPVTLKREGRKVFHAVSEMRKGNGVGSFVLDRASWTSFKNQVKLDYIFI